MTLIHCDEKTFFSCCGSKRWAAAMAKLSPFPSQEVLWKKAQTLWNRLEEADWLEAFAQHPRIGDVKRLREKWASQEQAGLQGIDDEILQAFAEANRRYEQKNGFVFLICATGKSAQEMLAALNQRLNNDRATELKLAAAEQAKITRLRLERILQ